MSDLVPINFLPVDLQRWDADPGGDVLVVPIWSDVRPLRGAAGLLDWRLCGKVSQMLREGRVAGSVGEKLLLLTGRVRWRRILGIGAGPSHAFGEGSCTAALDCALEAAHGLGTRQLARRYPGVTSTWSSLNAQCSICWNCSRKAGSLTARGSNA